MRKELKITKELTPKEMSCVWGACPAIFETNKNSYVVIGKIQNAEKLGISNRVAKDKIVIEIPKKLIDNKN